MARRAIWKGVVTFGENRVPVKLYSAVISSGVSFHLLHDKDKVRLRQQMVCELENEPVPDEEVSKGLQIDDNEYVLLEPEDLAELEPDTDRNIEVEGFIAREEIDPRFYDRPYHLGPDGEGHKYASLAEALAESGKAAICHWTFRKRFYNGVLFVRQNLLELVTLRLAEEVVDTGELDLPQSGLSPKERKTARYLVEELSDPFDPAKYRNDFQNDLEKLVRTKARGGEVQKREIPRPEPPKSEELMELLEASLKQVRQEKRR